MINWFCFANRNRYHNCFTYPCAIVSKKGKLLDFNREFKIIFDGEINETFSNIVEISHDHDKIITEKFNNKWELNYLQISKKEYHVVFFPYTNDNFLADIPSPLAVIDNDGNIVHFNAELQKYFNTAVEKQNLSNLFNFNPNILKAVEMSSEVNLDNDKTVLVKYKPTNCSTWIMSFTDKSEINEIKYKMINAQHLQSLGQLIAGISHDFNNMFTATSGFCEILIEKTKNTEIHEEVEEIMRHIQNAQDLSKQLVKFVSNNNIENCNPYNVMSDLSRIASKLVDENIQTEFDLRETNHNIQMSSSSLERIIINMIINSKDAMKDTGNIKISLREDRLDGDNYVVVSVSDNGCGIPKEYQRKVFDPFFSTKENGTGLGLSNIAKIVKNVNGKIDIQSNKDGTSISIFLPVVRIKKQETKKSEKVVTESKKILIVEDEAGIRKIICHALKKKGHKITEAHNGAIALEKLKKQANEDDEFDLMITDASLPELHGGRLSMEAKKLFPHLKILVISGYDEDTVKAQFLDYDEFLPKPFTITQLSEKVQEMQ
ncbi:hybrid sensor histidine kinase/response regulator [Candidatus Cytomitobacter indipagum]|nr:ATP-binding protein [Candidatus Cytomitobacter indipagum]